MKTTFPGRFKWSKLFDYINLIEFLSNYIQRENDHFVIFSKTRFIKLGLNYAQQSNTPIRQHPGSMLSANPAI
jgi:hypothetical protein